MQDEFNRLVRSILISLGIPNLPFYQMENIYKILLYSLYNGNYEEGVNDLISKSKKIETVAKFLMGGQQL